MNIIRLFYLLILGVIVISCGSSSVYEMPDEEQRGITYQLYQDQTSEVYENTIQALRNHDVDVLVNEEWQIVSSSMEEGRIETNWRETNDAGVGQPMDGGSNERYRIIAEISENNSGSQVFFQLEKQIQFTGDSETMGQWQMYEVTSAEANNLLNSLFDSLEEAGLTPQD